MLETREFSSAQEMRQHYATIRKGFSPKPAPKPAPVIPAIKAAPPIPLPFNIGTPTPNISVQYGEVTPDRRPRVKIETIQRAICAEYGTTKTDLCSSRRTAAVVRQRQIAMWLCRTLTPLSLPEIGRRFGGRDHTTCLYAFRKIEAERKWNAELERTLQSFVGRCLPAKVTVTQSGDA